MFCKATTVSHNDHKEDQNLANPTLATLGKAVRNLRGNKTLREAAREIKISPATLMRVEAGRVPDVETFGKLCHWLGIEPGAYLGFTASSTPQPPAYTAVSAHLKADSAPQQKTIHALATMLMLAVRNQKPTITNGDS
jgi:transcriptional regulator with XRE-family HTH domain